VNIDPPLLQVRKLAVRYPVRNRGQAKNRFLTAVRDISFDVQAGEIFGLVGETGCGKTSLARAILRLSEPSEGEVFFRQQALGGMNKSELRNSRREIQYLFQDPLASLSPRRTIEQSLREPLALYNIGARETYRARMEQTLATVGLHPEVLTQYPHELSGGQRQRVALARALVAEPALIIADEPMSSLDVSVQARIIKLILDVRRATQVAFLLISHDLAVIQQLADRVGVMYLGEMVELAPVSQLFKAPAHPYTRALLNAVPGIGSQADENPVLLSGELPSALTPPPGCVFHTRCPEAMEICEKITPSQTYPADKAGHDENHTVRCHLWPR